MRDVDKVRFRATPADDHAPVARISGSSEVVLPFIPIQFGAAAEHRRRQRRARRPLGLRRRRDVRGVGADAHLHGQRDRRLRDASPSATGSLDGSDQRQLLASPPDLPDGCTPGVLRISTGQALEFGAVAPGNSSGLVFTVQNNDAVPTSQLHARIATDAAGFTVSPTDFTIGPGETQDVTVTFTPGTPGHQSANLTLVASTSNRPVVHLVAHGFGGTGPAPGPCGNFSGPTLAPDLLFYADLVGSTFGILPDGTRFCADNGVHACLAANGTGSLDVCTTNADCVTPGETCALSSTCIGGDRRNEVCVNPTDCPNGFCRS